MKFFIPTWMRTIGSASLINCMLERNFYKRMDSHLKHKTYPLLYFSSILCIISKPSSSLSWNYCYVADSSITILKLRCAYLQCKSQVGRFLNKANSKAMLGINVNLTRFIPNLFSLYIVKWQMMYLIKHCLIWNGRLFSTYNDIYALMNYNP